MQNHIARNRTWWVFGLFCFVAGSRWLLENAVPAPAPTLIRQTLHHAVLLVLFALIAVFRRTRPDRHWLAIAGASALVFVVPDIVIAGASQAVTSLSITLIFLLVPVVVIFLIAQQTAGFGAEDGTWTLLGPALVGLAGAALMIPFSMPTSPVGVAWLAALVVSAILAGLAAVWLHTLLKDCGLWAAAALICGIITLVSALAGRTDWHSITALDSRTLILELGVALFFDGPLLLMTVLLLRQMEPIAFSTRYFLIFLVAVVESFLLLHPTLSWYTAGGALLMAAASAMLLRPRSKADYRGSSIT